MFSLFPSRNKRVSDPRASMAEAPKTARPWPFLAASPPVTRAPPRRSLSLPQHVAIFSDPQFGRSASVTGSDISTAASSAESSPHGAGSPVRAEFREMSFLGAPSSSGSLSSGSMSTDSSDFNPKQDKHQLRTTVLPDMF